MKFPNEKSIQCRSPVGALSIEKREQKFLMKERKKISLPIAQYNKEMKHTIGLSEYDGIRKMLNIDY